MSGQKLGKPGSRAHHEVAAYHEAGHAVVALLLGIRIVEVRIDHRQPGAGQTVLHSLESARELWTSTPSPWARSLNCEQRRAVVVALAGPLAEARFLGVPLRTLGSIGDFESIHQLMCKPPEKGFVFCHGAMRPDANEFFKREIRRTRRLLVQPPVWRAVSVVAGDLLSWGSLRGDDVAETVQWARGDGLQMGLFTGMNAMLGTVAPRSVASGPDPLGAKRWDDSRTFDKLTGEHYTFAAVSLSLEGHTGSAQT